MSEALATQGQGDHFSPPATIHYFVSYVCERYGGQASGWSELRLAEPIRGADDIKAITEYLEQANGISKVTILTFQRFET